MKAKEYILLERCVEDGVMRGFNRAYKYAGPDEIPSRDHLQRCIQESVMLEISEWFDFSDKENNND
jgi:hypothetical protein